MQLSDPEPFGHQKIAQHPTAGKGKGEMQFIHAPHHGQIGR
jgi:hypothetical protein